MVGHRPRRQVEISKGTDCWRGAFFAMGSPCELLCETDSEQLTTDLAQVAAKEAWRVEDHLSRYLSGNIVDQINSADGATVEVDDETARLVEFSTQLHTLSDGRFDITSGVLRQVWTFDGSDRLPTADAVDAVLESVGWHRVTWTSASITMPSGMEVDFGGVGKEYAVDRAATLIREQTDVSCLVNFGGDLAVTSSLRSRPSWQIGIESLQGESEGPERVISLAAGALATSGDARRFLFKNGIRYGHIIDPTTGWPVANAPRSVTVAADTCVQAGMLSTLAMLEGAGAEEFLEAQGVKFWCLRGP
jgi:thiamine biosynthesis lipoprotein